MSVEKLIEMHNAGTDIYRNNFSHDSLDVQGQKIDNIRAAQKKVGKPFAVLVDLQGPKHRIGDFKDGQLSGLEKRYEIEAGKKYIFDSSAELGDETRVQLPDADVRASLKVGDRLFLNDGKLEFKVVAKKGNDVIETEIVRGGKIWCRRGFNLPDTEVASSVLTEKDRKDLEFGLTKNPDFVAISFVQKAEDVLETREFIKARTSAPVKIIAKLERPQAVGDRLESIIEAADVIMVARGDLAVEMPFEEVPAAQRRMIRICRAKNKPVIVATQMMGSMMDNLFPSRAEVSDVATAGYLFADSTMTSEETSIGKYAVETTAAMGRILAATETDILENDLDESDGDVYEGLNERYDNIVAYAEGEEVAAIIALDETGDLARGLSCRKTGLPIVSVSSKDIIANQLCISRGVFPVVGSGVGDALRRDEVVAKGDRVVVVSEGGDKVEVVVL
jgi:pyruvate kinase